MIFANAGLTCSGEHPTELYERLVDRGVYPIDKTALEGRAYYAIDSLHDIEVKWFLFLGTGPNLANLYLPNADAREASASKG